MDFDDIQNSGELELQEEVIYEADSNFGMKSLNQMNQLRKAGRLCDIILCVGGKEFQAHRLVLCSFSPYFMAMFTNNMAECSQSKVAIREVEAKAMEQVIEFAYTGRLKIHVDTVQPLLQTASLLQLPGVQNACSNFLKKQLHPANVLGIHSFADAHTCTDLKMVSSKFAQRHFSQVVMEDEFLLLPKSHLERLIISEELNVDCEEDVYNAIIRWAHHDREGRRVHIADLLQCVRLPLLSANFLIDTVSSERLVKEDIRCRDLLDEAKNYHMCPNFKAKINQKKLRPRTSTVGVVHLVGGMNSSGHPLNSVDKLDFVNNQATPAASMNTARSGVAVGVIDGKLYAIGGHDGSSYLHSVECYDPAEGGWKYVAPMKQARRYVACGVLGSSIYAVGGYLGSNVLDCVEAYDPRTNTWRTLKSLTCKRRHAAVGVLGDYLYVVGGHDGNNYLRSIEKYDPKMNKWSMVASMQDCRGGVGCAVVEGKLYAMGGYNGRANLSTVERYYPEEDRWCYLAPMTHSRSGMGVAMIDNCIYAVAGHDGSEYLNSVEMFDPKVGEWQVKLTVPVSKAVCGVGVLTKSQHT